LKGVISPNFSSQARFSVFNDLSDKSLKCYLAMPINHRRSGLYGDVRFVPDCYGSSLGDHRYFRALYRGPDEDDANNRICGSSGSASGFHHGDHDRLVGYGDYQNGRPLDHVDVGILIHHGALGEQRAGNDANDWKNFRLSDWYNCNYGPANSCNSSFAKRYIRPHSPRCTDNKQFDVDNNEHKPLTGAVIRPASIF
jgi:hypothetical protein